MLTEMERIRSCKINALFCPEQHGSSSQHCTTGGAGGARETYAGEKDISGTRADIVCFKDATSVYFASTGTDPVPCGTHHIVPVLKPTG